MIRPNSVVTFSRDSKIRVRYSESSLTPRSVQMQQHSGEKRLPKPSKPEMW